MTSAERERERVETITDRYAIQVKTGDRRGALWQDDDGTWWLLAAGRRKDDGSGGFYRDLQRFSTDSSPNIASTPPGTAGMAWALRSKVRVPITTPAAGA